MIIAAIIEIEDLAKALAHLGGTIAWDAAAPESLHLDTAHVDDANAFDLLPRHWGESQDTADPRDVTDFVHACARDRWLAGLLVPRIFVTPQCQFAAERALQARAS